MGEIAEMMLDGTLCAQCGVYIGSRNGFATYCSECRRDQPKPTPPAKVAKVTCPTCGRKVKQLGLADHMRDAHGQR